MTRLSVEGYGRKYLLDFTRAAGVWKSVGVQLMDH